MVGALSKKFEHVNRLSKKVSCCGRALWCRPLCLSSPSLSLSLFLSPYTLVHSITLSLSHTHTSSLTHTHTPTHFLSLSLFMFLILPSSVPSLFLPSLKKTSLFSPLPSLPSLTHSRLVQMLVKNAKDIIDHIDEHTCCMAPAKVNGLYDIYYHVSTYIFEINMY